MENKKNRAFLMLTICFLFVFLIVNLLFLARYPFVHSDESWLAGLTRNIMQQNSFAATETFFNLKLRYPHAIKQFFHLLQMPLINIFGYGIFSVRLLSLLAGCGALFVFYQASEKFFRDRLKAVISMSVLACDIVFIYTAHFARQEIFICGFMLLCLFLFLKQPQRMSGKGITLLAVFTGISIGFHPNSFMLGCMCAAVLAARCFIYKTVKLKQLFAYIGITAAFALVFVIWSCRLDADFITHYLAYGSEEFDILAPVSSKFGNISNYFLKLYYGVSGTYYIPDMRLQLLIFPAAIIASLADALRIRKNDPENSQNLLTLNVSVFSILLGIVLIGRFSQLSIVFVFPMCWMLVLYSLFKYVKKYAPLALTVLLAAVIVLSLADIRPWLARDSYESYLGKISELVPKKSVTIGNLNSEFYFDNGRLLDYRNLSYMKTNGITVEEYVEKYKVEYIILTDELNYIYSQRPKWNILYGNLYWLEEFQAFVETDCDYVGSFDSDIYNMRISELVNGGQVYAARVYKVR